MSQTILGGPPQPEDTAPYADRIKKLTATRNENDPMWWNDLAVAHIRLGELRAAVDLLEPAAKRFPNDYGVHANLGTAYHLMGRYADAEKEIARDLEINPDAHFGLEKYHLALLQFLIRDQGYQSRHVYVDELTPGFLLSDFIFHKTTYLNAPTQENGLAASNLTARSEIKSNGPAKLARLQNDYLLYARTHTNAYDLSLRLMDMAELDSPQPYTAKWDLENYPKLKEGVLYMANMNPKEPACFQMLGVLCLMNRDRHLAVAAFEKAIALGSPQKEVLQAHINVLNRFITESRANAQGLDVALVLGVAFVVAVLLFVGLLLKKLMNWVLRPRRVGAE
jgi:hypothetical protein